MIMFFICNSSCPNKKTINFNLPFLSNFPLTLTFCYDSVKFWTSHTAKKYEVHF